MTIVRMPRDVFLAPKAPFLNKELSWGAKGVLMYVLATSAKEYDETGNNIWMGLADEDRKKYYKELEEHFYVSKSEVISDDGTTDTIYDFYEFPHQHPDFKG